MVAFLVALASALIFTAATVRVLRRAQFMDVPNHRSSHSRPVPRGGGIAVVLSACLVALAGADLGLALAAILGATLVMGAVGLADDLRSLPSGTRLVAQLLVAVCLCVILLVSGERSWWWLPVLVVAVAGYVNAFNFMDGVNGISALTAGVVGGWWAWAGHDRGHDLLLVLGLVLAGAALGFLPWNAPQAQVFLGDVGSYGLGLLIASLSVLALTSGLPWQWALAPLVVYGADTGWVLVKRHCGGRSLTEAHREHVYQRLVDGGWSHFASASLCAGSGALVCGAVGLAGRELAWWSVLAVVVVVLVYLNSPRSLALEKDSR